jgi:3-phosphoshikimate 1-carboxyvinyltransferase
MIKIHPSGKELAIKAPPSKSIFHRELIVNYILGARGGYLDVCDGDSNDIRATKDCLKAIDAVTGSDDIVLPVQESGSTLRFMIPVALALTGGRNRLLFKTEGRLIQRPLEELSDCLAEHGITISKDMSSAVVTVEGHLTPGRYVIDGSVSSQYISGLLMALSLFDEPSSVEVTGRMSSVHYIELTTGVLAKYGVDISLADTTYTVPGRPQGLELTCDFEVEGDWSNGAFLLCLGSLKNEGVKV